MTITEPGIYRNFPTAAYFGDPTPAPSFTQSLAKVLIAQSPLHAYQAHPRLNVKPADEDDGEPEAEKYDEGQGDRQRRAQPTCSPRQGYRGRSIRRTGARRKRRTFKRRDRVGSEPSCASISLLPARWSTPRSSSSAASTAARTPSRTATPRS
jgi:hypothetical protein